MIITGSGHCGKNKLEFDGAILAELTRCTCTFCAKTRRIGVNAAAAAPVKVIGGRHLR